MKQDVARRACNLIHKLAEMHVRHRTYQNSIYQIDFDFVKSIYKFSPQNITTS